MLTRKRSRILAVLFFGVSLFLIAVAFGENLQAGEYELPYALEFRGDGGYMDLGVDAGDLGIAGNREKTVEVWVFTRDFQHHDGIFSLGTTGDDRRDFSLRVCNGQENHFRGNFWGADIRFEYEAKDRWVHFALTHDGETQRIYANGELVAHQDEELHTSTDQNLKVGFWRGQDDGTLDGYVSALRVWDTARSEGEIREYMYETLTGEEKGLVGYWPLGKGKSGIAYDKSVNEKPGRISDDSWMQALLLGVQLAESPKMLMPVLIDILKEHPSDSSRLQAAAIMGRLSAPTQKPAPLLEIVKDTDDVDRIRLATLDALGEIEDAEEETAPVLLQILKDKEASHAVSRSASHTLGRIEGEKAQQARQKSGYTDWLMHRRDILRSRGGLAVMLGGVEDLAPAKELVDSGPWAVHWLDSDASAVQDARRTLHETGNYGRITVEQWEQSSLPYADNLANLIIADRSDFSVEVDELLRVLSPQGSAFINDGNDKTYLKKQRPEDMGEWTHPWHDADGSLSASDRAFDTPNAFQWVAGPSFPFADRQTSATVLLSAGGRTFQITQNVAENFPGGQQHYLVARDAFSGTLLWSREWDGPLTTAREIEDACRLIAGGHRGACTEIVTCGEKVYGAHHEGVSVFDTSTGDKLTIWPVEGTPEKLLLAGGILVAQSPEGLTAFDTEDGKLMWRREMDEPWGALAADDRVHCLSSSREEDGRWRHELLAVELESGDLVWKQPTESKGGHPQGDGLRLLFAGEGIVCLIEVDELRFLCAEDGSKLWAHETSATARRGRDGWDSRQAGHFLIDGKVWIRDPNSKSYIAFDPRSGQKQRETIRGGPPQSNPSCQPVLATPKLVFESSKAGTRMWNFDTGEGERAEFIRGGCQISAAIANGMAYTPPHACGCSGEWYYGNLAIVRSDDPGIDTTQPGSLQRGAAHGEVNATEDVEDPEAWPMYRRDGRRSGYLPQNMPTEIKEVWEKTISSDEVEDDVEWRLNFGRRLSPPVAAGGTVILADPQRHQVIALDKQSGEESWRFTAAGRVSSPPTVHGELVLFGAHDGYVYALRGSDGELVWRRRAAPSDRRIMAYGQVESAWPVRNVLVHDGVAIAAAGRAADAGGGAVVHGFEPESGEVRWSSRIEPYQARHGMPDLLVTDGEDVYMMTKRINTETGEISGVGFGTERREREWSGAEQPMVTYPEGMHYLRSGQAGFFETSWTGLSMGLRKHQSSWTWGESGGEIIAFSPDVGYAFQLDVGGNMWSHPRSRGGGKIEARAPGEDDAQWLHEIPAPSQVEAMLVAENALFAAGPDDRGNPEESGGFLRIINREDGAELAEIDLPAAPVHDGMAAADGRVFVTLKDGSVICLRDE